jgi:large subunit ribosomal protein L9
LSSSDKNGGEEPTPAGLSNMFDRLQEAAQIILFLDAKVIEPGDTLEANFLERAVSRIPLSRAKAGMQSSAAVAQSHKNLEFHSPNYPQHEFRQGGAMRVILLERVAKLGQMGEVVDVKQGYARNYLLPQGKALSASKANIEAFEGRKAQLGAQNLQTKKEADAMAEKLNGQQFIIIRSASDTGALYGSVTTRDASDAATAEGFTVDRKQVVLNAPIKYLGVHDVSVVLHPGVEATIELNVARSVEEAELQAADKSIQELAAEEEAATELEIQEMFDDIGAADAAEDEGIAKAASVDMSKEDED